MKDALTTQEVADRLGISASNVRYLVRSNRLTPSYKLPGGRGAMLFTPREIEKYRKFRAAAAQREAERWAS